MHRNMELEKRYATVDELTCSLDEANILLIYKEFNKCLKLCTEQLIKVRRHPDNNRCFYNLKLNYGILQ